MSFPRYPKYKPTGVEWLGEVPEHWEVRRLGTLFHQVDEEGNSDLPILSVSIHDGVSDSQLSDQELDRKVSRSDDKGKYKKVEPGDLVYNMMRAWQGGFGCVNVFGMVSPAYVVARPKERFSTTYIENLLRTPAAVEQMRRHSQGVTDFRLRLYWEEFKTLQIVLPPQTEQRAIMKTLDRETAKIDALVAEQQRLIELLKEKRQAVISHAVTKGLNPAAPLKPSGIEWLGEVPTHWDTWKLSHAFNIGSGTTPPTGERKYYDNGTILWVNTGDLNDGDIENVPKAVTELAAEHFSSLRVYPTDSLVIAMYGATIGKLGMLKVPATVNQACCVFYESSSIATSYLFYWFLAMRQNILSLATGGGQPNVSQDVLRTLRVACPSINEQKKIVDFLNARSAEFSQLIAEAERAIELLQERRTALISAAVTGKIDVRHLATVERP